MGDDMGDQILNFVAGEWQEGKGGRAIQIANPAHSSEVLWEGSEASIADLDHAVGAAEVSFDLWRRSPAAKRAGVLNGAADWLRTHADEVAADLSREQGKTRLEAQGEVESTARSLQYFAGQAQEPIGDVLPRSETVGAIWAQRIPVGVVACISPWNFPLLIPAYKLGAAIAFGNTVVLKPALNTPHTAMYLVKAFEEAGCPAGAINLIVGSGTEVGQALVSEPRVAAISFTGSNEVGTSIAKSVAGSPVKVQLEMGGKNPALVFEDADLDLAVDMTVKGATGMAGQRCTATSRVIAMDGIYADVERSISARLKNLRLGDPLDLETDMGPLVSDHHRQDVLAHIERGKSSGRLTAGGEMGSGNELDNGYFVQPTLFSGVDPDSPLAQEEIFGPVISLIRARSIEETIALANRTRFGLSASVFTSNLGLAMDTIDALDVGVVHINGQSSALERYVPFGGTKASGHGGREQGRAAREFFTKWKSVYLNW
ncbi:MAG: aldehyde dehydrogenase [Anaerolineales bacterium]